MARASRRSPDLFFHGAARLGMMGWAFFWFFLWVIGFSGGRVRWWERKENLTDDLGFFGMDLAGWVGLGR